MGLVVVSAITASASAANLLTNGSFEDGMNGWTKATFYWAGWGTGAPAINSITGLGTFGGFGGPQDGSRYAGFDISGHANYHVGAYQTFATEVGQTYDVTGWFAGGREAANDSMWWEIKVSPGMTSDPDAAGTLIAKREVGPNDPWFSFTEDFAGQFVATDSMTTVFLKVGRVQSADWKISAAVFDNLKVELVPEPAAALLLLAGLPLLRRRRA